MILQLLKSTSGNMVIAALLALKKFANIFAGLSWDKILPVGLVTERTANDASIDVDHYFSVFYLPDSISAVEPRLQEYLSARASPSIFRWKICFERMSLHELFRNIWVCIIFTEHKLLDLPICLSDAG
jgi:hypothetical protein